jgi:hypothetical protein
MNEIINTCVTSVNGIGRGFCAFAGDMFVQSTVLIVILLVADWLLRKRVKATFRYWIWMLVFIKLILPPSLSSPTSIGYWYHDWVAMGHPAPLTVVAVPVREPAEPEEPVGSVGWASAHADSASPNVAHEGGIAPVEPVAQPMSASPRLP